MPELLVSIQANLKGDGGFALGNVIGSNICNIGLVLGVAAVMTPIAVHTQFIKRELPFLVAVSLVFAVMLLANEQIDRIEGFLLTIGIIVYTVVCVWIARRNPDDPIAAIEDELDSDSVDTSGTPMSHILKNALFIVVGLVVLTLGANRLIVGSEFFALKLGVSKAVISLTVVAFGTSLPELATTIVACMKNESDLAAGNAIGSCLFNILCVAGVTASISPIISVSIEPTDLVVMIAFAIATFLLMRNGRALGRGSGFFLLGGYLAYIILLVVRELI